MHLKILSTVLLFAKLQDVWLDVFTLAYDKMTANVADGIALKKPTKAWKAEGENENDT